MLLMAMSYRLMLFLKKKGWLTAQTIQHFSGFWNPQPMRVGIALPFI
jgi:hypothetical protein